MRLTSSASDLIRQDEPAGSGVALFVVIVIYKMHPLESATFLSLQKALQTTDALYRNVTILIADNTPGGQRVGDLPAGVRYQAFPDNPGLVTPYNLAIAQAELEGCQWLLTLDQDTHLPAEFITAIAEQLLRYDSQNRVAAVVPRIFDNGVPISPLRFLGGFFPVLVGGNVDGVLGPHASALNSASVLRIAALKAAGGYDPAFPLNNSDTVIFDRLDRAGFRIALAGDVVVEHELAIMRREDRMTAERYRQLLLDERHFWDIYRGPLGRLERLLRLAGRLMKGLLVQQGSAFREITLSELRTRLVLPRARRIREANLARRS